LIPHKFDLLFPQNLSGISVSIRVVEAVTWLYLLNYFRWNIAQSFPQQTVFMFWESQCFPEKQNNQSYVDRDRCRYNIYMDIIRNWLLQFFNVKSMVNRLCNSIWLQRFNTKKGQWCRFKLELKAWEPGALKAESLCSSPRTRMGRGELLFPLLFSI
jgi:hypothetical protein